MPQSNWTDSEFSEVETSRPEKKLSPGIRDARHFVLAMHSFSKTNDENFRAFQDIFDARHFNFI